MKKFFSIGIFISAFFAGPVSGAQEISSSELRAKIDAFSLAVEDALDLNQGAGLFGMSFGEIDSTYLHGQGILLEVRTTLANQRNRSRLSSLNSVMRQLQGNDAFERLIRSSTDLILESQSSYDGEESFYRSLTERIANLQSSQIIRGALQQAADSALTLSAMGDLDDESYDDLKSELQGMRQIINENEVRLEKIQVDLMNLGSPSQRDSDDFRLNIRSRIEELEKNIASLRVRALEKAEQLRIREEAAEEAYIIEWESDVALFEKDLYRSICNFGAILDALPLGQRVSVVLKGLGDDSAETAKTPDKLHVVLNRDIQGCQNGSTDFLELLERSQQYSY